MVFPSTPVTVMTGSKLFVELITTTQRAVLQGFFADGRLAAGSDAGITGRDDCPHGRYCAHGCENRMQGPPPGPLLACAHPGVGTDHSKLAAGVMVNCRSGQTTFACAPLL